MTFGDAGSLNDLNVLDKSSIVTAMMSGKLDLRVEESTINNNPRDWVHFLGDGIYPEWAIFAKSYQSTSDPRKKNYNKQQEELHTKDIECAFGMLVKKFHVLQLPFRG